mmetsp:Transcript_65441/g.210993  ORF Transcript_65441/g.210993 Transcript_65441/m.210993 type:complete len:96 (-) Transcript_65441:100-387(-)
MQCNGLQPSRWTKATPLAQGGDEACSQLPASTWGKWTLLGAGAAALAALAVAAQFLLQKGWLLPLAHLRPAAARGAKLKREDAAPPRDDDLADQL